MTEMLTIPELVAAAALGEQSAWNRLVERYMPLVYSVIRGYRLMGADAEDVSQTLWLRLVEHLKDIREPRALPSWIVTTTKREALRVLKTRDRMLPVDPLSGNLEPGTTDSAGPEDDLHRAARHQALREGLAELPMQDRELVLLLVADPPVSYVEIGRRLGIPVGSIGPTRARCLNKLRMTSAIRAFLTAEGDLDDDTGGDRDDLTKVGR